MNKELLDLMKLQGEMRVALLKSGVPEKQSEDVACAMLDIVANSDCITPEVKSAYAQLSDEE